MKDLYETLGVARDADEATIKRAYRKAAKNTHPNSEGSVEAFIEISQALAVLTDARARAHYDETGNVDPPGPDNEMAAILQYCSLAILQAIQQGNVDYQDISALAVQFLGNGLAENKKARDDIDGAMKKMEKVRGNLRRKAKAEGPNILDDVLKGQIAAANRQLVELDKKLDRMEQAMKVLKSYTYETTYYTYETTTQQPSQAAAYYVFTPEWMR